MKQEAPTPSDFIRDIGLLIYGREDFKAFMARDLGISRPTLDKYIQMEGLTPKAIALFKGLCAIKAQEKVSHAELLREYVTRL